MEIDFFDPFLERKKYRPTISSGYGFDFFKSQPCIEKKKSSELNDNSKNIGSVINLNKEKILKFDLIISNNQFLKNFMTKD